MYTFLSSRHDLIHASDAILHQVIVEGVVNLQFNNECGFSDIIIVVINQCHLALEIIDVALEGLSLLHLDSEEVVSVLLKILSRVILVK